MILGTGIDMIEVERIAEKIGKEKGFRELVFSEREIAYCEAKKNKYEHYAARFAAKEAFFKAMGEGWTSGTAFNEVEISNDAKGKPFINLIGNTATIVNAKHLVTIWVSMSHLKAIASAFVIIEK